MNASPERTFEINHITDMVRLIRAVRRGARIPIEGTTVRFGFNFHQTPGMYDKCVAFQGLMAQKHPELTVLFG